MSASAKVNADGGEVCGDCGKEQFGVKVHVERSGVIFVDLISSCGKHIIKKFRRYTKREESHAG